MSLNETLQAMKKASRAKIPPETAAVMARVTEDLARAGIKEHALQTGDRAPDFELSDWQGQLYSSRELLQKGPLILAFYRGSW